MSWIVGLATATFAIAAVAGGVGSAHPTGGPFCPPLRYDAGAQIRAGFAGNHRPVRTLPYGRRSMIVGRLVDERGFGIPGETLCFEQRTRVPNWPYAMIGSTTTRADGGWSFKLPSGPSRSIRVNYGGNPDLISAFLKLNVRARATLHLQKHRTRPHRRIWFSGRIPGPLPGKRVVILRGTIPGAKRKYLVRRGRTDPFGRFRIGYAFSPVRVATRFVFWVVVPLQDAYPYRLGRSPKRFVRVTP